MRKLRTPGCARDLPKSRLSPTHTNTPWQTSACYQKPTGPPNPSSGPYCLTSLEYQPNLAGRDSHSHTRLASPRLPAPVMLSKWSFSSSRPTMYVTPRPCSQILAQSWGPQMTHNQAASTPCSLISWPPLPHTHPVQGDPRAPPHSLLYLCGFAIAPIHPLGQHCHLQEAFPDAPSRPGTPSMLPCPLCVPP